MSIFLQIVENKSYTNKKTHKSTKIYLHRALSTKLVVKETTKTLEKVLAVLNPFESFFLKKPP